MSKNFTHGEKMSVFAKRGAGARGCWLCSSHAAAWALQRSLGAIAYRNGLTVSCETIPGIRNGEEIAYTVVAVLSAGKP